MRETFNAVQKTCPHCNNPFIPGNRSDQVYCSDECRTDAKAKRKNIELVERVCVVCGTAFMPVQNKQICCSPKCVSDRHYSLNKDKKKQQAKEWQQRNPERARENNHRKREANPELYKQIESRSHDKLRFSGSKATALKRDGYKCAECGAKTRLAGHHIDGSGQTESRNDEVDNIQILCPSCHAKKLKGQIRNPDCHIKCTCQQCGKEFEETQARIDEGRGKFCSTECTNEGKRKPIILICEHCGIEFSVTPSRLKRGMVKYHNMECRKAAGYAWTKYSRTEYNQARAPLLECSSNSKFNAAKPWESILLLNLRGQNHGNNSF